MWFALPSLSRPAAIKPASAVREGSPALEARGVSVTAGGSLLVDDVSLTCDGGEVVGIIGPNGAGKSTLLKALAGITRPAKGSAKICGQPVDRLSASARSQLIAYAPQSAAVLPFTTMDVVLMGRYPYLRRFQLEDASDRRAAMSALAQTDTLQFAERKVDSLSGGERQRVMLGRVIAQDTRVILADEPVASLDIRHQLSAMALLRDRARNHGAAVVVVMHDLNLAAMYCDKILAMHNAKAVATGPPADIITSDLIREVFQVDASVTVSERQTRPVVRIDIVDGS